MGVRRSDRRTAQLRSDRIARLYARIDLDAFRRQGWAKRIREPASRFVAQVLMTFPENLDLALQRLGHALDSLDAAAARRARGDSARADLELEFTAMQDDRSRLAEELDQALARSRALDGANADVSRRLARAGATVRAILGELGTPEPAGVPAERA